MDLASYLGVSESEQAAHPMVICYSQRLVNPFRGILSVVETEDADAVSSDGVNWALYIHGEVEQACLPDGSIRDVTLPDIKYGDWSHKTGLKRAPVRNVIDHRRLDAVGSHLLAVVKRAAADLPFPLRDSFELWLLDKARRPLALLDVAVHDAERGIPPLLTWRPGEQASAGFVSSSPLVAGNAGTSACHVERLTNAEAGPRPMAQWFRRDAAGIGLGLEGVRIEDRLVGRLLDAREFPEFLVRTRWPDHDMQWLFEEFVDWQAPWLLQLQHLNYSERDRLEIEACKRAREMARCCRLYPTAVDSDRITAARVQATLCGAQDAVVAEDAGEYSIDTTLIPYYRE